MILFIINQLFFANEMLFIFICFPLSKRVFDLINSTLFAKYFIQQRIWYSIFLKRFMVDDRIVIDVIFCNKSLLFPSVYVKFRIFNWWIAMFNMYKVVFISFGIYFALIEGQIISVSNMNYAYNYQKSKKK